MQANWSLIVNILLLLGVFMAIGQMMRARHKHAQEKKRQPAIGPEYVHEQDDIIAVRKISSQEIQDKPRTPQPKITSSKKPNKPVIEPNAESLMFFLLAKENRQLAGYELLQTILAAGLRFGEGHLFHRHQQPNGQGPVLCSLAAATATGVFDLQNIGAFSVRGLCLFMQASGNATIDQERFEIMLDTAKQLSEDLNTLLLDDEQRPLNDERLQRYYARLNIQQDEHEPISNVF
ncbi:cell division protein ZipA C-terminal FtsZ-binding domain-containing protein [Legionella impletisoli]|uniref:Cell division protein ZipA n=1 Tax=Legionella impletisoli TaxID=343510 RepID=A0A917JYT1_9GAMM|nr:cell division protein ZipA C-terminal FtsZ-binding domain-containing protein [Legionella impletisoli]GGI88734.1 cell division protein ZipA [Legionella impletisoli]